MKYVSLALAAALLATGPASAQIVNGGNGGNGSPPAPIGTKGGGSAASMQAPGEAEAVAGAAKNDAQWRNMQPTGVTTPAKRSRRHRAKSRTGG